VSQENVQRAAAQYDRWNAEDFESWIKAFDPAAEYFSSISAGLDGSGRYVGHSGLLRFVRDYTGDWEYFRIEPIDYIDAGENVVVTMRTVGRGRVSGAEVTRDVAHVWTFRNGLVARHRSFSARGEALEAVGLEE
jgi:ketosteroid isomerase-like protein